jgi:hypothetical protein
VVLLHPAGFFVYPFFATSFLWPVFALSNQSKSIKNDGFT